MPKYDKGDLLVINKNYKSDHWLKPGDIVTFESENAIAYIVIKDGVALLAHSTQCESLSAYRKRILNSIIND